ncbi:hypothetical protein P43SY_004021 [Pythium insidiosum]|uniref:N-acetyltransferase domain-containing protein n=1 Tax=Pythium insidiosum TaxID=114742 RepID=A0AAD5LZS5_PYTIN|nr:hypothetical protein P43SY_004021 [Pythium insidiosum]
MTDFPSDWSFDAPSPSTPTRVVRVIALSPSASAAQSVDVQLQAHRLLAEFVERAGHPRSSWHRAIRPSFMPPEDLTTELYRTIVACLGPATAASPDETNSVVVGFTRVFEDSDHVVASSIVVRGDVGDALRAVVEKALFVASKQLSECFARVIIERRAAVDAAQSRREIDVWRGQGGASDALKQLLRDDGFALESTAHLRMTKTLGPSDRCLVDPAPRADGLVIRPLDLQRDDLVKIYAVHRHAFGATAPCFAAWKQHYLEQPRLAPELTSIAWDGDEPVGTVFLERIADGEGGDDKEVADAFATDRALTAREAPPPVDPRLTFAPDYAARRAVIETTATHAYVCGVATAAGYRSRGIAQALLLRSFQAAAVAGLSRVVLSTQRVNRSAVRAYERAGMAVTEAMDDGHVALKILPSEPITMGGSQSAEEFLNTPLVPQKHFVGTMHPRYVKQREVSLLLEDEFWSKHREQAIEIRDLNADQVVFRLPPSVEEDPSKKMLLDAFNVPLIRMQSRQLGPRGAGYSVFPGGASSTSRFCDMRTEMTPFERPLSLSFVDRRSGAQVRVGVTGKWLNRCAVVWIESGQWAARYSIARIYRKPEMPEHQYLLDIAPGVDIALMVLIAAAMDEQTKKHQVGSDKKKLTKKDKKDKKKSGAAA